MPFSPKDFVQGPVTPGGKNVTLDSVDANSLALSALVQGTNGQIPIGHTSAATAYQTPSGDLTVTNAGVFTVGAGKITKAKMALFGNHANTGTGSSQTIAHGLGVTPTFVTVIFTGSTADQAVTYGTHTGTNVVVTVTTGATFDVIAIA